MVYSETKAAYQQPLSAIAFVRMNSNLSLSPQMDSKAVWDGG